MSKLQVLNEMSAHHSSRHATKGTMSPSLGVSEGTKPRTCFSVAQRAEEKSDRKSRRTPAENLGGMGKLESRAMVKLTWTLENYALQFLGVV